MSLAPFTAVLLLLPFACFGQSSFQKEFTKSGGMEIYGADLLNNKDFIISPLTRLDSTGAPKWSKMLYDAFVQNDRGNGFVAYGYGGLLKLDDTGGIVWGSACYQSGGKLLLTNDGGYLTCGQGLDTGISPVVHKFDSLGNSQWAWRIRTAPWGNDYSWASFAGNTANGNYVVAGTDFSSMFLMKFDNAGSVVSAKRFWVPDYGYQIFSGTTTYDKGFVLYGWCRKSSIEVKLCLSKIDSAGNMQWSRQYEAPFLSYYDLFEVRETADHGFVMVSGTDMKKPLIVKTDSTGQLLWSRIYNREAKLNVVLPDPNGGYTLWGSVGSANSIPKGLMIKADATGSMCFDSTVTLNQVNIDSIITDSMWYVLYPMTPCTFSSPVDSNVSVTDSTICTFSLSVPESPEHSSTPSVYPNPTNGQMTFVSAAGIRAVIIYSTSGKMLLKKELFAPASDITLDLQKLPPGLYWYILKTEQGTGYGKLLKE